MMPLVFRSSVDYVQEEAESRGTPHNLTAPEFRAQSQRDRGQKQQEFAGGATTMDGRHPKSPTSPAFIQ